MQLAPILVSIAPIFLLILLGYGLRRGGIPNVEFWNLNDRLVYWVLMPALLFYQTARVDLSAVQVGTYVVVISGGFVAAMIFGIFVARAMKLDAPAVSSVMQGAARHNTFIALSTAERLFGMPGLSLAALTTAILIPITNLSVVPMMVVLIRGKSGQGILKAISRDLVRNPLLLSIAAGLSLNAFGGGDIPVLLDTAKVLGNAALPIVLLCVGANLRLGVMRAGVRPIGITLVGKFLVFPATAIALAYFFGLSKLEASIAVLYAASPAATSAYTLARQMGGDAPLMAAINTIQTALAFLTLPLSLLLVDALF